MKSSKSGENTEIGEGIVISYCRIMILLVQSTGQSVLRFVD